MKIDTQKASTDHRRFIPLLIIGVGLIILGTAGVWLRSGSNNTPEYSVVPAAVSFTAPQLILNDLNSQKVDIADYRQDIVLINNWATWCPPCKAEMPTLLKYYNAHKDDGFTLIGIEAGDPKEDVESFVEQYKLTFPILLDPNTKSLILFHNDSLPSSYVIDHSGTVVLAWTGPISSAMLEKYVTPLLEK